MRLRVAGFAVVVALCATLAASPVGASNDPDFVRQWPLEQIGAPSAWNSAGGAGVRIGVVDTGVDLAHEDLSAKVVDSTNCIGSNGDPMQCTGTAQDDNGHGSHVSGIAAAVKDNGRGIAGVAPDAQLVVAKAVDGSGRGSLADIVAGIRWVVDHGAQVVNLSLGDPNFIYTSTFGTDMRDAIEYAWSKGAVPVLASGNTNLLGLGSSNYGDIHAIVVGATDHRDQVASYSSPLGNAQWAILAPGGAADGDEAHDVFSTYWQQGQANSYRAAAGTSMSAPHVAGAVALLLGKGYTAQTAVTRLLETAHRPVDCQDADCTGRLDVARAVA